MNIETSPGTAAGSGIARSLSVSPCRSLQLGRWVKLICGASYQDMPAVRRLVMLYALAGVDCIDVAADGAVVAAARRGLDDAVWIAGHLSDRKAPRWNNHSLRSHAPWLMVSLNDSEDPHFRKAYFDVGHCPSDCDRPCASICPTAAIQFQAVNCGGVVENLCYGCGRCIAVCPIKTIEARPHLASPTAFPTTQLSQIDAVEIHTQTGHQSQFEQLWRQLQPWMPYLKLVSISCPDHDQVVPYLRDLCTLMAPLGVPLIWQTDGRPMSGDLGKGTTHAAIRLAQKILAAGLPGYVQPAGGTNGYTVSKLTELGLINNSLSASHLSNCQSSELPSSLALRLDPEDLGSIHDRIAGIAYGSYARSQVMPLLDAIDHELQPWLGNASLNQFPNGQWVSPRSQAAAFDAADAPWRRLDESALGQGLALSQGLVNQLKSA